MSPEGFGNLGGAPRVRRHVGGHAEGAGRSGSRFVEVAFRVRELGILAAWRGRDVTTAVNRASSAPEHPDLLLNASIIALLTVGQTCSLSPATSTSRSARCSG